MFNDLDPSSSAALRNALRRQERELRMMALDLHDGLLQYVVGALYHLDSGVQVERVSQDFSEDDVSPVRAAEVCSDESALPDTDATSESIAKAAGPAPLDGVTTIQLRALESTRDLLQRAIAEGRRLIRGMRPPILVARGLIPALEDLAQRSRAESDVVVEFENHAAPARYSSLIEGTFFRIAQEALSNACRHSRSPRIALRLFERGDRLRLEVQDWGIGFDKTNISESSCGLSGIQERAEWLAGDCEISTSPGKGTLVSVELPISEA